MCIRDRLCINFDAAKYSRMAQELLALSGAHQEPGPTLGVENFVSSLPDAVQALSLIHI